MTASGHLLIARNGTRCKHKWGVLYGHFNHIFDHMSTIEDNTKYWDLTMQKKTTLNVLQHFNKLMYKMINSLWGGQPMLHPPLVQDLMVVMMVFIALMCCSQILN
jgi:hypothetical protein